MDIYKEEQSLEALLGKSKAIWGDKEINIEQVQENAGESVYAKLEDYVWRAGHSKSEQISGRRNPFCSI